MSSILLTALFLSPLTYFATDSSADAASIFSGTCEQSVASSANVQATDLQTNGNYYGCQVKFTAGTNSWTVPPGVTSVKLLVVGGGGGGGSHVGGGGGGGAVYENLAYAVTPQTSIPITVGAGGAGAIASGSYCVSSWAYTGGTSVFGSVNVLGGGNAASWVWQYAGTGANGGGGSVSRNGEAYFDGAQGVASTGWSGFRGGNGLIDSSSGNYGYPTGGGAGAAGNGFNALNYVSGNGGPGKLSDITGTYFGGGGGGGFHGALAGNAAGTGGIGGGGNGNGSTTSGVSPGKAGNGATNTGGGGGGSGAGCSNLNAATYSEGGNGGSGLVLIQYTKPSPVMSSKPVLSGTANQGATLNTSAGTWTNSPSSYSYQWQSSADQSTWTDISGATSNEYKLTSNEATKYVRSVVTARNSNDPAVAASDPIGPISSTSSDACTQTVTDSSSISVTEISSSGVVTECVVKFKSGSNTWTRPAGVSNARLLLVGGGGAGGAGIGGGGGAGEMVEVSSLTLNQSTYSVAVGGGGLTVSSAGPAGSNSTFSTVTAYGGGGGGVDTNAGPTSSQGFNGYLFGSGGGGGFPNTSWSGSTRLWGVQDNSYRGTMLAGMTADRNNGGFGSGGSGDSATAGGGGGAGGAGGAGDTTSQAGGVGGAGKASDITGTTQYFAAGGGGGVNGDSGALSRGIPGVGGSGIGGSGGGKAPNCTNRDSGNRTSASSGCWGYNGVTNTGSGGGGGSNATFGGDGGSGVVIIRYALAAQSALSLTPTTTTFGTTQTLSTTGGSGSGAVSYTVTATGTALCSLSGATLSFTAAGTCTVKAAKATQGGYLPVSTLATTVTVNQASLDTVATPTVSATSGVANSIDVSWTSVTNADTYYVKLFRADTNAEVASKTVTSGTSTTITSSDYASIASIQNYKVSVGAGSTDSNYALGTHSAQVAVTTNIAQSTLTVSPTTATFGETRTLSTSGGSGTGAVTIAVTTPGTANCSITGTTLSYTAAGTCAVTATKAASTGYLVASSAATTITVNPANMGTVSTPTVTATAGVLNSIDVSWSAVTNADRYQVKLTRVDTGVMVAYAFVDNATSYTLTTADYSTMSQTRNYTVTVAAYSTTGNYAEGAPSTSVAVTTNQTLTVTYSYGGATGGNSTTSNSFITGATALTLPTPTKTGYTLSGWYSASSGGTKVGDGGASYSPSSTETLYAQWTANTNTVTFNNNNGSGTMANQSIYSGQATALTAQTFTRTGYTFSGWNTAADGTGSAYTNSQSVTLTGGLSLFAQWTKNSNTVTFGANGGVGSDTTQSILTDTATALTSNTFTRLGYLFSSWNTVALGGGTSYTNGQSVTITGPMNLYAQWTANTNTVTFNNNTGSGTMADQSITTDQATALTTNSFTKTGYSFNGWNTAANGSGTSYSNSQSVTLTSGLTLYAQWTANTNTVTFNNNTGSGTMANQSITSDQATALTANSFTKTGYTFTGWNTAANGSGTAYTNNQSVTLTSGLTLYAQWTTGTYTVTYNYNNATGGNGSTTANFTTGGTAITLPTPTRTGYTFAGWFESSAFTGNALASTYTPTASATIYASWTQNVCSPTSTVANGYTVYQFTSATTCEWSVPNGVSNVEALVVAGGGGGGYGYDSVGGGGGAGGQVKTGQLTLGSTVSITVGSGGTAGSLGAGGAGQSSSISSITSLGGGGGCASRNRCTTGGKPATASAAATGGIGGSGGASPLTSTGGGGSNTAGSTTTTTTGGSGLAYNYLGSSVTYGSGGAGGVTISGTGGGNTGAAGSVNSGTGGGGGSPKGATANVLGGEGGTGVVYVRVANSNTVTYDSNGGSAVSDGSFLTAGSIASAPTAPTKADYTFLGWSATNGGAVVTFPYAPGVISSITLYAKWTQSVMAITYDANGASGSAQRASENYNYGATAITLPTVGSMVKAGYTFDGWSLTNGGTRISGTIAPTVDTTYYARWVANNYTVTYSSQGSTGGAAPTDAVNYNIGNSAVIKTNSGSLAKSGYTLSGWTVNSDGSGTLYQAGGSYVFGAGNVTLYPKWAANTNVVTFNANDGSGTPATSTQNIVSGTSTALTANSYTRTGYTFAGWNTAANGSGTAYVNSAAVTILASVTLYAQWTPDVYTVTYNVNSGSGSAARSSDSYTVGTTALTLPGIGSLTRTGYTFDGWATTVGGVKMSSTYTPTATITLYARWVAVTYNITYNDNSATSGAPSATSATYTTGGSAITLATQSTMARTGYTFNGWSTTINDASTKILNSGSYTITAPVVLYALWNAVDYSVTYSNQGSTGGAAPTDATVFHIGDAAVIKANTGALVKTGYTFAGWTVASDGSGTVLTSGDSLTIGSASVTLYPKWTANTYTITYNTNGASGTAARTSDTYTSGTTGLSLPAVGTMAKTGYDFGGWSPSPTGSALSGNGYTTTTNHTLYAIWNLKTINYTYARGVAGGTSVTGSNILSFPSPSSRTGLFGSVINLDTTISRTALVSPNTYQFMGWNDSSSIYSPGDAFTLGETASTFTAEWVRLYEVRYALNGGSGIYDVDTECLQVNNTCLANQAINLSEAPTRPGYTFTGWKDQSNANFAAGVATTVTSSSFIYYAQWQAIDYTMAFNSQGGSASPAQFTKYISESFTLPSPGTKTGYSFTGWFDGTNTYGVGANYTVGTASKTFVAVWTANVYTVTYNWNGGTGTAVPDVNYTYGTAAITLPTGSSHTRDGYVFAGWATSQGGAAIADGFVPTADTMLYARWNDGAYAINLNAHGGTLGQSSQSVSRGSSMTLPAPTRDGFVFDGWYEDAAATLSVGAANTSFSPSSSQTLHAKWVQNSLAGINPAHINSLASITVTGSHTWSGTHSASGTGAALDIPNGALPSGTVVKVSFIEDLTRPRSIIDNSYAYYTSVAVHWLSGTGDSATVPATAANKPLTLVLTNPAILPGAKVFMIIGGVATEVAEATQAGEVSIEISQDPEFVIAATKPTLPASVSATAVSGSQATVTWTAPSSTGGAPITGYTVTATPGGATCSTTTELSCVVTGLSSGTTYSYSVVADNAIGSSGVRSTTVTYVPPPVTPAPANIIPVSNTAPRAVTVSEGVVTEAAEPAQAEVSSAAPAKKATSQSPTSPQKPHTAAGESLLWILFVGILLIIAIGLTIMWLRRTR